MDTAGKKFLGEHDFRNFCKMDVANVHCYTRRVTFFEVSPCQNRWALVKRKHIQAVFSVSLFDDYCTIIA